MKARVKKLADKFRETKWKLAFKRPKGSLTWTILYIVGMITYTILLFGLSIGAVGSLLSFKSSNDYAYTQELVTNWEKNYISDITIINANENCPVGYESWHDREWPGIYVGCNCINNNGGFRKMVMKSQCTTLQLNSNCQKIHAMDPIPLEFWKESSKVCIQRADVSFMSSPENCENGYKKCGVGKVRFCVEESKQCPISDVIISEAPEIDGYTQLSLTETKSLFYRRNDSNFPISTFKLSESGLCIFDAKDNISPGRLDYVLSKELRTQCPRSESRFVVLDSQGEKSIYQNNNLYTTLKSLPGYPLLSNDYTWSLGFVRYFQWDDLCRNGYYSLNSVAEKIQLNTVRNVVWIMFGVTMISILVTGIILPIRHLKKRIREEHVREKYVKKQKTPPKKDYKSVFSSSPYLTDKVFKLVLFPVVILAIFFTQRENKWFVNAQLNQCGDDVTNSYFASYSSKLKEINGIFVALMFFWLIMLGADIAYATYLILKANIKLSKFFESKIRRDEEKIIVISEDELRGLRTRDQSMDSIRITPEPPAKDTSNAKETPDAKETPN